MYVCIVLIMDVSLVYQMNMFLVQSVLQSAGSQQVMLFDKHPDGPYMELIEKAFSPGGPVIRPSHYRGKKVCTVCVCVTCLLFVDCICMCMYVCMCI